MLERDRKMAEEKRIEEQAAKQVIQRTIAEEYRRDMERKMAEKNARTEYEKETDKQAVNRLLIETDTNSFKDQIVVLAKQETNGRDGEREGRDVASREEDGWAELRSAAGGDQAVGGELGAGQLPARREAQDGRRG